MFLFNVFVTVFASFLTNLYRGKPEPDTEELWRPFKWSDGLQDIGHFSRKKTNGILALGLHQTSKNTTLGENRRYFISLYLFCRFKYRLDNFNENV